ncbi:copper transporting P-type ATPase, partial [Rhizoctonia solani AG-3 Rhs1AP]
MTLASHVGRTLLIGNAAFISDTSLPPKLQKFTDRESAQGRSVVFASLSKLPILAVSLSDVPKPSSAPAIKALHSMGTRVCLMTGDSAPTAHAIAHEVGIPREYVWAGMSPKGKAAKITEMGKGVAMVGDGINDSPALVAASVGIALSSGTSIAVEAADIVLMRSSLLDVVAALHLSRSIFSTIRRNLVWACVYNILGIPLAMGVGLPWGVSVHPMLAGGAMAFSSVSVVGSSLLLRFWKRPYVEGEIDVEVERKQSVLGGVWENVRGWKGKSNSAGYQAVPVEMVDRV